MSNKVNRLAANDRPALNYILFGFCAFIINFLAFSLIENLTLIDWADANLLAWILATVFSYYTNRAYVFRTFHKSFIKELNEMTRFFLGRGVSLIIEQLILWFGFTFCDSSLLLIKLTAQIFAVILNYLISKFLVFKK